MLLCSAASSHCVRAHDVSIRDASKCVVGSMRVTHAGEVTQRQLAKGLQRARARLDDSKLDCPQAESLLEQIVADGIKHKWLEPDELEV